MNIIHQVIPLNYQKDLIVKYSNLAHLPGFVLLESRSNGRYDIISAMPYEKIEHKLDEDPRHYIEQLKQRIPSYTLPINSPFHGGAIGYFSYDFAESLYDIKRFSQPVLKITAWFGLYDWAIVADHFSQEVFLMAANHHGSTKKTIAKVLDLWNSKQNLDIESFSLLNKLNGLLTKDDYYKKFHEIHNYLYNGRCYQVNFTQNFFANYIGSTWTLFKKIRSINPVPFSAYLKNDILDIVSFSPERFLTKRGNRILTSPIKGTCKRSTDPEQDKILADCLLNNEKNRAENTMIVDMWRNDFSKIADLNSIKVIDICKIESYNNVHHLVSYITADCNVSIHPIDLFVNCFPGSSITGAPKLEAMRVIAEQEDYSRGVYCGSIGYFSANGDFDSNIAIRTISLQDNALNIPVGGGLMIDSNASDEYEECLIKISALCQAF